MCKYCPNSRGPIYNFNFEHKIKKTVNIAMYTSIRMIRHSAVNKQFYLVCSNLYRRLDDDSSIEGRVHTDLYIRPLEVLYFVTGSYRVNYNTKPMYIKMLQVMLCRWA